jgi:hypothetical protein
LVFKNKPTQTDATIHYESNHPIQHKLAAYCYHINRMLTLPINESAKNKEWNRICTMAKTQLTLTAISNQKHYQGHQNSYDQQKAI